LGNYGLVGKKAIVREQLEIVLIVKDFSCDEFIPFVVVECRGTIFPLLLTEIVVIGEVLC